MISSTIFSVIISISVAIPMILLKITLNIVILKPLGVLISLGVLGLCFYISLTNAALMGVDKSNNWAFSYMNSWLIDSFCV